LYPLVLVFEKHRYEYFNLNEKMFDKTDLHKKE